MTGTNLGPYKIVEPLGAGGMGEVYLAEDTRLGRKVAVKVLPAELADDASFRQRFEREAKTISQLQHPNVCALHDVGEADGHHFLVMEYLEGETLERRLRDGALKLEEVIRIGGEIAEAVHAAHRRGLVHRDLKPGNIMLTESGVKVLDFGLAKEFGGSGGAMKTEVATMMEPATAEGSIVGTLHYMAPEQLEGKEVDARADIWALGCVLYEMATGSRPFSGESGASLISNILKEEPQAIGERQPVTPRRLDWVVSRCLHKDRERRWQSARDVAIELGAVSSDKGLEAEITAERPAAVPGVALWAASLLVTAILVWFTSALWSQGPEGPVASDAASSSSLPVQQLTARPSADTVHSASISPNGEQLAFATREGLFLQNIQSGEETLLALPPGLQVLEVDWLGTTDLLFSASTGDAFGLYRTSTFGAAPRKLTDGAWRAAVSPDGTRIAYLTGVPARSLTVAGTEGEEPRVVIDMGDAGSMWEMAWSPDGRWLLVGLWGGAFDPFDTAIEAVDMETDARTVVLEDPDLFQNWRGVLPFWWGADNQLVIGRREAPPNKRMANLWQAPIDPATARLGELTRITSLVGSNPKDISGTRDGRRLAFLQERNQMDVMVATLEDGGRRLGEVTQVTQDERQDAPLVWGPDDSLIIWSERGGFEQSLFRTTIAGDNTRFIAEKGDGTDNAAITPDGASVLFWSGLDLIQVPIGGGPPQNLLTTTGWPGIDCIGPRDGVPADGRCWIGERSPDDASYGIYPFDPSSGRGEEAVLRFDDRPPFTNWDVSPDGTRVVVSHNDDGLRVFDLATRAETEVNDERISLGEFAAWSADGRGIFVDGGYVTRGRIQRGLVFVSLDDGEVHVLRLNWAEWNTMPRPSPDGTRLAFGANFFYDGNAWMIERF